MGHIRGKDSEVLAADVKEVIDTGASTILVKTGYGTKNIDRSQIVDMDKDIKISTGSKE